MRLDYMDYQIVYLEDTGDACVYRNEHEIIHAFMDKWLSADRVVDSLSYIMRIPGILAAGNN